MLQSGFEEPAPVCRHCTRALVDGTHFCPHCGLTQSRQSFRGPIVLGIVALLLIVLGGGVAVAAFSTLSSDGFSGVLADAAGPTVNDLLSSTGSGEIDLLEDGSGASTATVLSFLGGVLAGLVGALLICVAIVWAIIRTQLPRRGGAAYARTAPAVTNGRDRAAAQVDRARPHVERAVQRTKTEVAPRVADGARRGREALEKRRQRRT